MGARLPITSWQALSAFAALSAATMALAGGGITKPEHTLALIESRHSLCHVPIRIAMRNMPQCYILGMHETLQTAAGAGTD